MPTPLKPGFTLRNRYKIQSVIGQGGMGCIYLAEDLRLAGRLCAVKEVEQDQSLEKDLLKEARDQFQREATTLARLDHPNLPKVSDFFIIGDRDYLVMDFVPGKDLRTLIMEARLAERYIPENEVLGWAHQLADALTYLHQQQPPIVHRDIKPSNLKLTPNGLLKLVDFGLVKLLAPGEVTITILQGQGTALYTPLEQYGGDSGHTDARSDVYAFGATLYHLLTNEPPLNVRDRFLNPEAFLPPRQVNPAISAQTERAILWAMQLHPSERPADVETFQRSLTDNDLAPMTRPFIRIPEKERLFSRIEMILAGVAGGLTLLTLFLTLLRSL